MNKQYDALSLFSGGLDSILAARVVMDQGLSVLGLHFVSPFFGHPDRVAKWRDLYGVEIEVVDVGNAYVDMMRSGPKYGYGKILNPCVDCKIFMLRRARELMKKYGAKCLLSGEVVGQRPMSQRRDALNAISRDAQVRDVLVRPLCAKHMDPTPVEEAGIIDREKLPAIGGRGRKVQIQLAKEYGFTEIPTPAGGCKLAEMESARRYWPVFRKVDEPRAKDFYLADTGRQYWSGDHWLTMGRNQRDNEFLESLLQDGDLVFRTVDYPGPFGVGRQIGGDWSEEMIRSAAALLASFSTKAATAAKAGAGGGDTPGEVRVSVLEKCGDVELTREMSVAPDRAPAPGWHEPDWAEAKEEIRALGQENEQGGR